MFGPHGLAPCHGPPGPWGRPTHHGRLEPGFPHQARLFHSIVLEWIGLRTAWPRLGRVVECPDRFPDFHGISTFLEGLGCSSRSSNALDLVLVPPAWGINQSAQCGDT